MSHGQGYQYGRNPGGRHTDDEVGINRVCETVRIIRRTETAGVGPLGNCSESQYGYGRPGAVL